MIDLTVPFYSNTSDDTHCLQAALRMALKYFEPDKDYSWEELERLTGKKEGLWTWSLATLMWMHDHGYEVVNIEMFDYGKFIAQPESYLVEFYGEEAAKEQIAHSYLPQEVEYARQLLQTNLVTKGVPTLETIKDLLTQGYVCICLVNSRALNGRDGYVGHMVVVKGIENDTIIIHDPGLPSQENRRVSFAAFEKAWAYPDEKVKNVMAFKHIIL